MQCRRMHFSFILFVILLVSVCLSACSHENRSEQEKLSEIVADRFLDIQQLGIGHEMSLEEAEAILSCWASGEDISDKELREAIYIVLDCNEEIRDLIFSIDEIVLD